MPAVIFDGGLQPGAPLVGSQRWIITLFDRGVFHGAPVDRWAEVLRAAGSGQVDKGGILASVSNPTFSPGPQARTLVFVGRLLVSPPAGWTNAQAVASLNRINDLADLEVGRVAPAPASGVTDALTAELRRAEASGDSGGLGNLFGNLLGAIFGAFKGLGVVVLLVGGVALYVAATKPAVVRNLKRAVK